MGRGSRPTPPALIPTDRSTFWSCYKFEAAIHIVITGASSGLGAALAYFYAAAGTILSLAGRDLARLQTVAAGCRARGAEVAYEVVDVTDAAGMDRWLRTRDTACGVDLLIANAGIGGIGVIAPDDGEAGDVARQIIEINVIGVLNTITPLLRRLVGRRRGHVAIVSSLAGFLGLPDAPSYCASKAAVRIYAEALRRRLAPHGVCVTAISPGFVDTPMSATLPFIGRWLWPADRAARHIAAGLARGKHEIVFPWQLHLAVRFAALLPTAIIDRVLIRRSLQGHHS